MGFLLRGWTATTRKEFSDAGWGALVLTAGMALLAGALVPSSIEGNTLTFLVIGAAFQLVFTLAFASLAYRNRQG